MHVKVGNVTLGQGAQSAVDQQEASPNGDIALLHLTTAINTTYMTLGSSNPAAGSTNQIYGWRPEQQPALAHTQDGERARDGHQHGCIRRHGDRQ